MNSNYMFAFNRRPLGPPAPVAVAVASSAAADAPVAVASSAAADAPVAVASSAAAAAPVAVARSAAPASGRFSINRLINFKSSGGCRSCN